MGVFIDEMNLGKTGWIILLVWTVWTLILPLIFELFTFIFKPSSSGELNLHLI
jgi:uncharacterized membrane protein